MSFKFIYYFVIREMSSVSSVPTQASSGEGIEMCLVIPLGAGGLLGPWFLLLLLRLTRSFLTVEKYRPV